MKLPQLSNREQLPLLFNVMGLQGQGAEIGVAHGNNAAAFRQLYTGGVIYLIDCWSHLPESEYQDTTNVSQEEMDLIYTNVLARFSNSDVIIMRSTSQDAAQSFASNDLDWVYIDANHSQEAVFNDVEIWYDRVRSGGIISGHDYGNSWNGSTRIEVKHAIDKFVEMHGLQLTVTTDLDPSWYFMKP